MLPMASRFELDIWSFDIDQDHTSGKLTTRLVYIKRYPAFGFSGDNVLQIMRPLYGLSYAGDISWKTLNGFFTNELGISQLVSELYTV